MSTASIILQVSVDVSQPVSTATTIIFFVVLLACVGLFFYYLKRTDRYLEPEVKPVVQEPQQKEKQKVSIEDVHEEEAAAIALAISMYKSQMHDMESLTITLQKVSRIYSPWSSKIYTLRQNPRFK